MFLTRVDLILLPLCKPLHHVNCSINNKTLAKKHFACVLRLEPNETIWTNKHQTIQTSRKEGNQERHQKQRNNVRISLMARIEEDL
jgi:hypothetical protein